MSWVGFWIEKPAFCLVCFPLRFWPSMWCLSCLWLVLCGWALETCCVPSAWEKAPLKQIQLLLGPSVLWWATWFPRAISLHGLSVCSSLAGLEGAPAHLRWVNHGDGASRRGACHGQRNRESLRLNKPTSLTFHGQCGAAGWIGNLMWIVWPLQTNSFLKDFLILW